MKNIILKLIKVMLAIFIILGVSISVVGHYGYQKQIQNTPIKEKIYVIQQDENYVTLDKIQPTFLRAIVAVEDHRFYKHGAVDIIALTRASIVNIKAGKIVQGGSTITQQLAKNLYLTKEKTLVRKIKELFLAYALESFYTKDEILELYVNVIYYGDGFTGIQEAARGYFGKDSKDLTYEQCTLLAGLPQAPSRYALSSHYDRALKRQQQVLNALNNGNN